jgi:hypothetical protein
MALSRTVIIKYRQVGAVPLRARSRRNLSTRTQLWGARHQDCWPSRVTWTYSAAWSVQGVQQELRVWGLPITKQPIHL